MNWDAPGIAKLYAEERGSRSQPNLDPIQPATYRGFGAYANNILHAKEAVAAVRARGGVAQQRLQAGRLRIGPVFRGRYCGVLACILRRGQYGVEWRAGSASGLTERSPIHGILRELNIFNRSTSTLSSPCARVGRSYSESGGGVGGEKKKKGKEKEGEGKRVWKRGIRFGLAQI